MGCNCTTEHNEFSEKSSENSWLTSKNLDLLRCLIVQLYNEERHDLCKTLYILYLHLRTIYGRVKSYRKLLVQTNKDDLKISISKLLVEESDKLVRTRDVLRSHLAPAFVDVGEEFELVANSFKRVRSEYREVKKYPDCAAR